MTDWLTRTELLLGKEGVERLQSARVAVFGIGGVGGYVCEALVRSGIGAFDLIDHDTISLSNLNRQIIATRDTLGQYKTEVMKARMLSINPSVSVRIRNCFFLPENAEEFPFEEYDYVVDCVDTVTAKIELILRAQKLQVPVISAMGAGNKLNPAGFRVADIYETSVCPLAKVMRRELKKRGVKSLKVVFSEEMPVHPVSIPEGETDIPDSSNTESPSGQEALPGDKRRFVPGSVAFVPSVCGLILAGEVVKDLIYKP